MTTYKSCVEAIKKFEKNPNESNVSAMKADIQYKCSHEPTPCEWVGNSIHYACLKDSNENPQRVYTTMSIGGHSRILKNNHS